MINYYMPVKIRTGADSVKKGAGEIAKLGKKCLIVTGASSAKKSGALDDVTSVCRENNIEFEIFDGVEPNPTVSSCIEAGGCAAKFGAEFIVGIGGGSALDAAKAVAVFAADPTLDEAGFYTAEWPKGVAPIVLVGTTAGTGSEVTDVSVLTDSKSRKHSIHDPRMFAKVAFGDAKYLKSASRALALSTGIDAFAHSAESYFAKKANTISRANAAESIRLLYRPLTDLAAGKELTDEQLNDLYEASIFGGLAISVTGTCFPHNVGYYLTENKGIPHGEACAVFHPAFIRHCENAAPELVRAFEKDTGLDVGQYVALCLSCLSDRVRDVEMGQDEIAAALPRWENNGSVKNSPGNVTSEQIGAILCELFN